MRTAARGCDTLPLEESALMRDDVGPLRIGRPITVRGECRTDW
jgi:hypothetical protein